MTWQERGWLVVFALNVFAVGFGLVAGAFPLLIILNAFVAIVFGTMLWLGDPEQWR